MDKNKLSVKEIDIVINLLIKKMTDGGELTDTERNLYKRLNDYLMEQFS